MIKTRGIRIRERIGNKKWLIVFLFSVREARCNNSRGLRGSWDTRFKDVYLFSQEVACCRIASLVASPSMT